MRIDAPGFLLAVREYDIGHGCYQAVVRLAPRPEFTGKTARFRAPVRRGPEVEYAEPG